MKNSYRTILSILLLTALLIGAVPAYGATGDIQLYINGVQIHPDVPPFLLNNRTLVPVRVIAERLGADVGWVESQKKVTIVCDQASLVLYIDSPEAWVNGRKVILDTVPIVRNGRTMVPIRFISERLGAQVRWDEPNRRVYVDSAAVKLTAASYRDGDQFGRLVLETSGGATFLRTASDDGSSLVVDLPGTAAGMPVGTQTINQGGVRQTVVSVSSDGSARVRIDLEKGQLWQEEISESTYTLNLPRMIRGIRLEDYQGRDAVGVSASGRTSAHVFTLEDPLRVVCDLTTAVLAQDAGSVAVEHPFIQQIRFAQHDPEKVRIVADLAEKAPYRLVADGDQVRLVFAARVQEITVAETAAGVQVQVVADNGLAYEAPAGSSTIQWLIPDGFWSDAGRVSYSTNGTVQSVWTAGEATVLRSVSGDKIKGLQVTPTSDNGLLISLQLQHGAEQLAVQRSSRSKIQMDISCTPPPPLSGRQVAIDPGHGGSEPGAVGPTGTTEKAVNLAIALKLRDLLTAQGATVIMTRDQDVSVSLLERAKRANQANADIFISIHANGFYQESANGTETYYNPDNHPRSGLLGQHVHREMLAKVALRDRGLKTGNYTVLKETMMPSILVEVAFLTNPAEELLLKDSAFQQKAAQGITQGVLAYFQQYP